VKKKSAETRGSPLGFRVSLIVGSGNDISERKGKMTVCKRNLIALREENSTSDVPKGDSTATWRNASRQAHVEKLKRVANPAGKKQNDLPKKVQLKEESNPVRGGRQKSTRPRRGGGGGVLVVHLARGNSASFPVIREKKVWSKMKKREPNRSGKTAPPRGE